MQPVALNATLTRLLQFMGAVSAKSTASASPTPSATTCPNVMMDKAQIEQVVKNIVINAAQAMPRGGYITVSTRYFPGTDIVEMAFTDTGVGIPPEKHGKNLHALLHHQDEGDRAGAGDRPQDRGDARRAS